LGENRNAIAIKADQSQWLGAQSHVKEVINSIFAHMPISSNPSPSFSRRKSGEEKKATSALQPSPVDPHLNCSPHHHLKKKKNMMMMQSYFTKWAKAISLRK